MATLPICLPGDLTPSISISHATNSFSYPNEDLSHKSHIRDSHNSPWSSSETNSWDVLALSSPPSSHWFLSERWIDGFNKLECKVPFTGFRYKSVWWSCFCLTSCDITWSWLVSWLPPESYRIWPAETEHPKNLSLQTKGTKFYSYRAC